MLELADDRGASPQVDRRGNSRMIGYRAPEAAIVSRAMTRSSSVGMTKAGRRLLALGDTAFCPACSPLVAFETQPAAGVQDAGADRDAVLADAGGEDQTVNAAHADRQRAGGAGGVIDKVFHGQLRQRRVACQQSRGCRWTGPTSFQAAFVVQEMLDAIDRPALLLLQPQDDAGVQRAGACAHRQAVERGEAHGGIDAAPIDHGAHRGAGAKMGDDNLAGGDFGRLGFHRTGDIGVGQAVKAVAPHAFLIQRVRDGEAVRHGRMAAMKGGIEAGDMRHAGKRWRRPFSTSSAGGLCSGASGETASMRRASASSTRTERFRSGTAMHDTMAESGDLARITGRPAARPGPPCGVRIGG